MQQLIWLTTEKHQVPIISWHLASPTRLKFEVILMKKVIVTKHFFSSSNFASTLVACGL